MGGVAGGVIAVGAGIVVVTGGLLLGQLTGAVIGITGGAAQLPRAGDGGGEAGEIAIAVIGERGIIREQMAIGGIVALAQLIPRAGRRDNSSGVIAEHLFCQ